MKQIIATFLVIGFLLFGNASVQGQGSQDDRSSLDIRSNVIYGGDQEANQFDHYGGRSDLFLEENNEQSRALLEQETSQLDALDKRLFQTDTANKQPKAAPSSGLNLFPDDYVISETVVLSQGENTPQESAIFFWSALIIGSLSLLVLGWVLGRRFSKLFRRDKEWL